MSGLSTDAPSNSPQGSEALSVTDDNIRALASIIRKASTEKTATYSSNTITLGEDAGEYLCTLTTGCTSIVGGYSRGFFTIVFLNSTPYTISASSTIAVDAAITVSKGDSIVVKKETTGVFSVVAANLISSLRTADSTLQSNIDTTNDSVTTLSNALAATNVAVDKRNQIVWGYTDGDGYYGDQYLSNMGNTWLHTAINIPVGVWEVTGYSAMIFNDSVSGSVPVGLVRADNTTTGVNTPAVFQHFKGDGGQYIPAHVKAIIVNDTGSDQNYRLKTGSVTFAGNRQGHGLFGSSVGETKMWAVRLY